jgi:thioredoxin-related protein
MKKIFFLLFISLITLSTQAQEIKWMSFNEAVAAQKKNKKPIFIDVYTAWCGPCKLLDSRTFSDPSVAKLINEKYNAVKFNAEGNEVVTLGKMTYKNPGYKEDRKNSRNAMHEFAYFLKVQGYPAMVVLNNKQQIQKTILGFRTPEELKQEI